MFHENKNGLRILVADDHPMVRRGVIEALTSLKAVAEVHDAEAISDVLELLSRYDYGLILLDLLMPGMDGFKGFLAVQDKSPSTAVAILSGVQDRVVIEQALDHGAAGYIVKTSREGILLHAVNLMLAGGVYVPPEIVNENDSAVPFSGCFEQLQISLTPRQKEILSLIRDGLSNKEIARQLNLDLSTVKGHVTSLLRVLDVPTRAKAARKAARWELGSDTI